MPNVAARSARLRLAPLKLDLLSIFSIIQGRGDRKGRPYLTRDDYNKGIPR